MPDTIDKPLTIRDFLTHIGIAPLGAALRAIEKHNMEHVWLVLADSTRIFYHSEGQDNYPLSTPVLLVGATVDEISLERPFLSEEDIDIVRENVLALWRECEADDDDDEDDAPPLLTADEIIEALDDIADDTALCLGEHLDESVEALSEEDCSRVLTAIRDMEQYTREDGSAYAEDGYTDPVQPFIFLGDWWLRKPKRALRERLKETPLVGLIHALGGHTQWEDEWSTCSRCDNVFRITADGYSWKPSYAVLYDEQVCSCCLEDDTVTQEDYLGSLEDNPDTALTLNWDPGDFRYIRLAGRDFEHGLHPGQAADPKVITKSLEGLGFSRILYKIERGRQFDTDFSCWVHADGAVDLPCGPVIGIEYRSEPERWTGYHTRVLLEDEEGLPVLFNSLEEYQTALRGPWSHLSLPEPVIVLPEDIQTNGVEPSRMLEAALRCAGVKMKELPEGRGVKYASLDLSTGTAEATLLTFDNEE